MKTLIIFLLMMSSSLLADNHPICYTKDRKPNILIFRIVHNMDIPVKVLGIEILEAASLSSKWTPLRNYKDLLYKVTPDQDIIRSRDGSFVLIQDELLGGPDDTMSDWYALVYFRPMGMIYERVVCGF